MISLPPAETFDKEVEKKERRPVVARHPRKIHCGSRADVESRESEKEGKKEKEERRKGTEREGNGTLRHPGDTAGCEAESENSPAAQSRGTRSA